MGVVPNAPDTVALAVAFDAIGTGPDGAAVLFALELQPVASTAQTASVAAAVVAGDHGRWASGRRDKVWINVALQGRSLGSSRAR